MKNEQTGEIKLKKVLKAVATKYKIKKENIDVTSSKFKEEVQFKFEITNGNKYNIKETITLNLKDIIEIILSILKEDNIFVKDIRPKFKHIDGDLFEPLDYGYYKLKGFEFDILQ